jgi:hypothetical protein
MENKKGMEEREEDRIVRKVKSSLSAFKYTTPPTLYLI